MFKKTVKMYLLQKQTNNKFEVQCRVIVILILCVVFLLYT